MDSSETTEKRIRFPVDLGSESTIEPLNEPLLLRLDMATYAFYRSLSDDDLRAKKMMELVSQVANVNVLVRLVNKKELRNFKVHGQEKLTREIMIKYNERERQLLQSGTWDINWGLRWLLSYLALVESPVLGITNAKCMLSVVDQWIDALGEANISEVVSQLPALKQTIAIARDELIASLHTSQQLSGKFNTSCSLLFAGELKETYIDLHMPKWALADQSMIAEPQSSSGAYKPTNNQLSLAEAWECVASVFESTDLNQVACVRSMACDLRIKEIATTVYVDCINTGDCNSAKQTTAPFYKVTVCVFDRQTMADQGELLTLLFESNIVANLRVGFILEATLHTLDNGYHYIDAVTMVWPSYTPLDYVDSV
ncbi:hypothetical protein GGI25_000744 [Coemansia spiralis]|uniref:Uncharacterized protein n=2 Tax=Coemansia TaxID=4863 RepID=A0A9W8GCB2_9FUNG|nr:hypothetical protein BX070DRAFT_251428 [Coemansia spiralis]KAJ1995766.1 hypothetical protein EDC05_000700 [Coemansia umbellata]KAJ2621965.1 hypothetical protein GGI26_003669 [Coemansia sp. RSA 1358]KAJ2680452.1 hypothetical protein GGI25_000744 [Coemansia spiralis]